MVCIEWNKYIKWGKFTSTHGIELPFKWEFDRLEKNERDRELIYISVISSTIPYDLVVIHTVHPRELENYAKAIYYPTTGVFNKRKVFSENRDLGKYVLFDDVVTTGKSMLECIEKIGRKPERCICIVDRRKEALKSPEDKGWFLDLVSIEQDIIKEYAFIVKFWEIP